MENTTATEKKNRFFAVVVLKTGEEGQSRTATIKAATQREFKLALNQFEIDRIIWMGRGTELEPKTKTIVTY